MITSAKVIPGSTAYEVYARQGESVKRGHKDFIMSRSELTRFAECPEKWLLSAESDTDTKATLWGRLVECLEMAPELFSKQFAVIPENYTTTGMECPSCGSVTDSKTCSKCKCARQEITIEKPWNAVSNTCSEWQESKRKEGLSVVPNEVYFNAQNAVKIAQSYEPRVALVAASQKQVMVVGEFESHGIKIPIRCLIDLVPDASDMRWTNCLADSKTARNGNPEKFDRVIDDLGYDAQAALSIDLFNAATGREITSWILPVQENTPPYHVVKPMPCLSSEFILYGRAKYQSALTLYAQCLATDTWPSYSTASRLLYGDLQIIGPDGLFKYKQSGGGMLQEMERAPSVRPTADFLDGSH